MTSVRVLDTRVDVLTRDSLRARLADALDGSEQIAVSKLNTEFLLRARRDPSFAAVLERSALHVADGRGVLWAAHYLSPPSAGPAPLRPLFCVARAVATLVGMVIRPDSVAHPLPEHIPGTEAFDLMLDVAARGGHPVFVYGARPQVLEDALTVIEEAHPELIVAGGCPGYGVDEDDVVARIVDSGARMVFVALGSPAQESWIDRNLARMPDVRVAVGEGGTLDFLSGDVPLPPNWMRRSGLEWAWRLVTAPSRSASGSRMRRVFDAVVVFTAAVIAECMSGSRRSTDG